MSLPTGPPPLTPGGPGWPQQVPYPGGPGWPVPQQHMRSRSGCCGCLSFIFFLLFLAAIAAAYFELRHLGRL
jgi:hypothetical protein